jgi:hypothetical protein
MALDIMRTAFSFYTRLIEVTRIEEHEGSYEIDFNSLLRYYQEFRIAARVLALTCIGVATGVGCVCCWIRGNGAFDGGRTTGPAVRGHGQRE